MSGSRLGGLEQRNLGAPHSALYYPMQSQQNDQKDVQHLLVLVGFKLSIHFTHSTIRIYKGDGHAYLNAYFFVQALFVQASTSADNPNRTVQRQIYQVDAPEKMDLEGTRVSLACHYFPVPSFVFAGRMVSY